MQSKTSYFESGKFNVTLNLVVVHCIAGCSAFGRVYYHFVPSLISLLLQDSTSNMRRET